MLAGRAFQGVGSGVILCLVEIVVSDLVSLSERYVLSWLILVGVSEVLNASRGGFQGAFGAIWALAAAAGSSVNLLHTLHY
jgi:MFS family permease